MRHCLVALVMALCIGTLAQATPVMMLNFENALAASPGGDDTPVSDQYASSHGITFSLLAGVTADNVEQTYPTFELRGQGPGDVARGFLYGPENLFDVEAPQAAGQLGDWFLKSCNDVANVGYVKLIIQYAEPVLGATGEIWDIDGLPQYGTEQWEVTAFNAADVAVDSSLSPVGDSAGPGTLDGLPWTFNLEGVGITRIEIESVGTKTQRVGLAFDNFATVVPEPASLGLLLCGGFWLLRRH